MPNWTKNIVTISGPKKDVQSFKTLVASDEEVFDFDNILPMPVELVGISSGGRKFPVVGNSIVSPIGKDYLANCCKDEEVLVRVRELLPNQTIEGLTVDAARDLLSLWFRRPGSDKFEKADRFEQVDIWRVKDNLEYYIPHEELVALTTKCGATNWYDWCIKYWGCKWSASNTTTTDEWSTQEKDTAYITYEFNTPWSAPEGICANFRERFPALTIEWLYELEGEWENSRGRL